MKVLIVTQYFWPENFRINDLSQELVLLGHEVTILTGTPSYPVGNVYSDFKKNPAAFNEYKSASIVRVPIISRGKSKIKLALNYLSYVFSTITIGSYKLRRKKFDLIFVYEPSPVTVGLTAIWIKKIKKVPVIFWTLDLWPESLSAVDVLNSKITLSLIGKIVQYIYNRCDLILAQSHSFIPSIRKHCKDEINVEYFPSWAEKLPPSNELAPEVEFKKNTFDILFTGNLGEAQDFPAILEAAEILKNEELRWLVVGNGRMHDWIKVEIKKRGLSSQFILLGEFPIERMTSFYNHSQALLVSLKADYYLSLVIPAKVQSYLMSGLPILGMIEGETERIINDSGCGYVCKSGEGYLLAEIVKKMMKTSIDTRKTMGIKGLNYATKEFDRDELIKKLESWMHEYADSL
jgi:glycosyltransferase involved in cell wall biosynthesis